MWLTIHSAGPGVPGCRLTRRAIDQPAGRQTRRSKELAASLPDSARFTDETPAGVLERCRLIRSGEAARVSHTNCSRSRCWWRIAALRPAGTVGSRGVAWPPICRIPACKGSKPMAVDKEIRPGSRACCVPRLGLEGVDRSRASTEAMSGAKAGPPRSSSSICGPGGGFHLDDRPRRGISDNPAHSCRSLPQSRDRLHVGAGRGLAARRFVDTDDRLHRSLAEPAHPLHRHRLSQGCGRRQRRTRKMGFHEGWGTCIEQLEEYADAALRQRDGPGGASSGGAEHAWQPTDRECGRSGTIVETQQLR